MSLQERTIVVRNFDPEKTTDSLLKELCLQAGPVRKVVMRPDHAFVEYEDMDSVGYSRALLDGVVMFDRPLNFEPKLRLNEYHKYTRALHDYIAYDRSQRAMEQQRLLHQQQQEQQQQMQYQLRMQMLMQQQQQATTQQLYISPPQMMPFEQYQPPPPPPPRGFYR